MPVQDVNDYVSASDGVGLVPLVTLLDLSKRRPGRLVRQLRMFHCTDSCSPLARNKRQTRSPGQPAWGLGSLRKEFGHDVTGHVRQPEIPAQIAVRKPGVIEAKAVQNGGLQIVNVDGIFNDVESQIVG